MRTEEAVAAGRRTMAVWRIRLRNWANAESLRQHEDKVLLVLTLIIGTVVGLTVVAFILVTENLALRLYPAGGAAWLVLFALTGFFTYYYHAERQASAEIAFKKGKALAEHGGNEEAIEQYRTALSISHSREHRLVLAMTLEKVDRLDEAGI